MDVRSARRSRVVLFALLAILWLGGMLSAQAPPVPAVDTALPLETGRQIFEAACVTCHGPGGEGQPLSTLGFEPPVTFPDFTDCNGSSREKMFDWAAVIHEGGPGRGFSEIMPSFADALTLEQIYQVRAYLRELCTDPAWPHGEMNLPRPLFTEKAFPEDEWVFQSTGNATGDGSVSNKIVYEKRFGARNQLEIVTPFAFAQQGGGWTKGVGDLVLGYKRALFASLPPSSMLSVQGELILPTGNPDRGLGAGVTVVESFASFAQLLPGSSFIQAQSGGEFPTDTEEAARAVFARVAVGKTFAERQGFGRIWSPMVELLADREFESGARANWDLVPQVQVSLNRRQHVRLNVGVRRPLNNTDERTTQVVVYALWDFFDGGLRDGW